MESDSSDKTLGILLLAGLFSATLIFNALGILFIDLMDKGPDPPLFLFVLVGDYVSQPMIVGSWLIIGNGKIMRRVLTFAGVSSALISAWALGMFLWGNVGYETTFWWTYGLVLYLPLLTIVGALPLLILRCYANFRLESENSYRTDSVHGLSIGNLMSATALVAAVVSLTQFVIHKQTTVNEYSSSNNILLELSLTCAFTFAVGLIVVLPSVFLMMRGGTSRYWAAVFGLLVVGFVAWTVGFWCVMSLLSATPPPSVQFKIWLYFGVSIATSQLCLAAFLGALRLAGLRLVNTRNTDAPIIGESSQQM